MAFYSWNTSTLVQDLAHERVTELDALKYALGNGLLVVWAVYWAAWFGGYPSWASILEFAVAVVITVFGTTECYSANGGGAGKSFLRNFACIGWPVNLKLTVLWTVLSAAMYFGFPLWVGATFKDPAFVYSVLIFCISASITFAFYWRVASLLSKVKAVAQRDSENEGRSI
jgi:hypothetical protein